MDRRDFLKGAAGLVLACGAGFGVKKLLGVSEKALLSVGPLPAEGLTLAEVSGGAEVYQDGALAFRVNKTGAELLRRADGTKTLNELIRLAGCEGCSGAAASFFITLGKAGYLQNRVEVDMVERRT